MYSKIILIFMLFGFQAQAHEMTPAYPKFTYSHIKGVSVTKMLLWNRREDSSHFEIKVFSGDWKEIPFASTSKLMKVRHTKKHPFDVYIRNSDLDRVTYICTSSKSFKGEGQRTIVTSRICSKVQ